MSIQFSNGNIYKNAKPHLILSGEIHYFRIPKDRWETHLDLAISAGMNTIATYVPWIVHEEVYRTYDFTGNLDLASFLDLCQTKHLDVILRPGPFVMAELKNEGLPYWLYDQYPDIVPKTWHKQATTTHTVDYLHPDFLNETKIWFEALYTVIQPYLLQNGGPIIAIQLDNEVGMLSWISNQPDFTPFVEDNIKAMMPHSIDFENISEHSLEFHHLLGLTMRKRFQIYIDKLQSFWKMIGVTDVLYMINIHGTVSGHAKQFPVGISQLIDTYYQRDILAGTDLYFGNIDLETFHELYIVNAFMRSTLDQNQPYGTLEFNVSDGNFGDDLARHYLPSAIDFKIRISIAQDQKFLNYYLLSGGINPILKHPLPDDHNRRVAITGARHGFAAPIQVDGSTLYTFEKLRETTRLIKQFSSELLAMKEAVDDIVIGFVMDHYMNEYQQPNDDVIRSRNDNINLNRNSVYWDTLLKHLLLLHYQFAGVWLEHINHEEIKHKLLIVNTAKYMSKQNQMALINHLKNDGKAIFVGDLPVFDMIGHPLTLLVDYLGIKPINNYFDWTYPLLTLTSDIKIFGENEFRSFIAQTIETQDDGLFKLFPSNEKVGFKHKNLIWITSNYPGHLVYTQSLMTWLNIKPKTQIADQNGHLLSIVQSNASSAFIHLLNLEHHQQTIHLHHCNQSLFDGHDVELLPQEGLMLPINLHINKDCILYSTLEIQSYTHTQYNIVSNHKEGHLKIRTVRKLLPSDQYMFTMQDQLYDIAIKPNGGTVALIFK